MRSGQCFAIVACAGLHVVDAHGTEASAGKVDPLGFVKVCTAFGAGFFYIPGTDMCLRLSGRSRYEAGYASQTNRSASGGVNTGDTFGSIGLLRLNIDARTQTEFGALRAFLRLDAASRAGNSKMNVGTFNRIGLAFNATGQDQSGRLQQFVNVDKAFVQLGGLTAGRASSYFDFYGSDYEIIGTSLGSSLQSTNLVAYTQALGQGLTATLSMEDPTFRKNPIYSLGVASIAGAVPAPIILGTNAAGNATALGFVDAVQRTRVPDFVGALRYDSSWGSAQVSAAVKDVNHGNYISGSGLANATPGTGLNATLPDGVASGLAAARGLPTGAKTEYGYGIQAGVKVNLPFLAPGDGFYLQGAYARGANLYTGVTRFSGSYANSLGTYFGNPFNQSLSDAVINPITGRLDLFRSFSVVGAFLHYWTPEWRSGFYGSYGEIELGKEARAAISRTSPLIGSGAALSPPSVVTNPLGYTLSPALRGTGQFVGGVSLIWSPVKDLDIGIEGQYSLTHVLSGRIANSDKGVFLNNIPTRTTTSEDFYQTRFRVQRDF